MRINIDIYNVRLHLAKVYACLTGTIILAAVGDFVHAFQIWEAGLLSYIGLLVLLFVLSFTADNGKHFHTRLAMVLVFGFLTGHCLRQLIGDVLLKQSQISVTALIIRAVVFALIRISSSFFAQRDICLRCCLIHTCFLLVPILMSFISTWALFSLGDIFIRSAVISQTKFYMDLAVMSAFISWYAIEDIMEEALMGSRDYIGHSLKLFLCKVAVFRKLVVILIIKHF